MWSFSVHVPLRLYSPASVQAITQQQSRYFSSETLRRLRCFRSSVRAVVRTLLFDVLLEQSRQVSRVSLQHGGRVGGQHGQAADQLALDNGYWRQSGVAHHTLCTQQRVVYAGSCWGNSDNMKSLLTSHSRNSTLRSTCALHLKSPMLFIDSL